jgi:hypothetical protein
VGIVIMKFTHAIARVLKGIKIRAGRGVTFGAGVTAPFVASLPIVRSRAPTSLSHRGSDRRVVAASSIPQGICGNTWMAAGEQGTWPEKDHCQEKLQEGDVVLASP